MGGIDLVEIAMSRRSRSRSASRADIRRNSRADIERVDDAEWQCKLCEKVNEPGRKRCSCCGRTSSGQAKIDPLDRFKQLNRWPVNAEGNASYHGELTEGTQAFSLARRGKEERLRKLLEAPEPKGDSHRYQCEHGPSIVLGPDFPIRLMGAVHKWRCGTQDMVDEWGNSLLMAACQGVGSLKNVNKKGSELKHATTVKTLLEFKANPNMRNTKGQTALHMAKKFGYEQVAKILIDGGANQDIRDWQGHTAEQCLQAHLKNEEEAAIRFEARQTAQFERSVSGVPEEGEPGKDPKFGCELLRVLNEFVRTTSVSY